MTAHNSRIPRWGRKVLPPALKRVLREAHRRFVWRRAIRRVLGLPAGAALAAWGIADLSYGWGNEEWSASPEFLRTTLESARTARGPIVECGSGLSTLLLGIMARESGTRVWTLEHDPIWAARLEGLLAQHGIDSVEVLLAPIRDYGSYSWYDVSREALPEDIALVVCDGPPGNTDGGRYGLLPAVRGRLAHGCVIFLDDAARAGEQNVLERWRQEAGWEFSAPLGSVKPFACISAGSMEGAEATTAPA
jgi:predicted O-methyltransferase YrrM